MSRILIVGESWVTTSIHTKGFDSFTTVAYEEGVAGFRDALTARGHEVVHQPSHLAADQFPYAADGLEGYDVIVLSDIGANTFLLPNATFLDGDARPNRLAMLRDWVADGGGLAMIGGYLSFQGFEAKANYRATPLAEALPVLLETGDDREELPADGRPRVTDPEHPLVAGLAERWEPILGYQRLTARPGAAVPVTVNGHPLVVTGAHGAGRTLAFATDIGPHWAPDGFVASDEFGTFWDRAVRWLAGPAPAGAAAGNGSAAHAG
jgi:uncharacterized membrane protein